MLSNVIARMPASLQEKVKVTRCEKKIDFLFIIIRVGPVAKTEWQKIIEHTRAKNGKPRTTSTNIAMSFHSKE